MKNPAGAMNINAVFDDPDTPFYRVSALIAKITSRLSASSPASSPRTKKKKERILFFLIKLDPAVA